MCWLPPLAVFVLLLAGLPWWWIGIGVVGLCYDCTVQSVLVAASVSKGSHHDVSESGERHTRCRSNIIQSSELRFGWGGLAGQGWGLGTQSHLNFIPEQTTDFAFSVLSEEFGWVGVTTVLMLYLFVIMRCLWIAGRARNILFSLACWRACFVFFCLCVWFTVVMISGLLPVVGVPMPLMSYGGTSAVSLLVGFGLVMGVRWRRRMHHR